MCSTFTERAPENIVDGCFLQGGRGAGADLSKNLVVANPQETESKNDDRRDDGIHYEEPELPPLRIFSYVVGHFFNDLSSCLWFSFFILFFESVKGYSKDVAGSLFLLGQATMAVSTQLVGLASDRFPLPRKLRKFGKRKAWHALGKSTNQSITHLYIRVYQHRKYGPGQN